MSTRTRNSPNVTGHRYDDDIEEYDNPLPGWWSWIFAVSIVFSAVYFFRNKWPWGHASGKVALKLLPKQVGWFRKGRDREL